MEGAETIGDPCAAGGEARQCAHMKSGIRSQFGHPRGRVGHWIGHLMAWKNATINRTAVDLLDIQPEDEVLEIGYGPGTAIKYAAAFAKQGRICGIDHSEAMLQQASHRNRVAIEEGRVELRQGLASSLPWPDNAFDRVLVVNNYHIWKTPEDDLKEVRRILKPGGTLLLGLRLQHPRPSKFRAPGLTEAEVQAAVANLRQAGFETVRIERRSAGREVACVIAN